MTPTQQGAAPQQGVPCAVNKAGIQSLLCAPHPALHPTAALWALHTQPRCAPVTPHHPAHPTQPPHPSVPTPPILAHPLQAPAPPPLRCSDPHFPHPHFTPQPAQPQAAMPPQGRAVLSSGFIMGRSGGGMAGLRNAAFLRVGSREGRGLSLPVVSVHGQRTLHPRHPRRCAARGAWDRSGNQGG